MNQTLCIHNILGGVGGKELVITLGKKTKIGKKN